MFFCTFAPQCEYSVRTAHITLTMQLSLRQTLNRLFGGLAVALTLTACNATKEVIYFQDAQAEQTIAAAADQAQKITVEPGDEIMVYVSCDDLETAARLSLLAGTKRPQLSEGAMSVQSTSVMIPYQVDQKGDIEMPLLGRVHVGGMTRKEISKEIADKIIAAHLVKAGSLNVTVQFANLTYSVMGEVAKVGKYSIDEDQVTLLEALASAGDLTIYGRRDAVWVIREQKDGTRKMMKLDLRGTDFINSPGYYIQQNDVIYVEPNEVRAGQSTINENTFKSVGFWTSLVSVAVSVTTLIVTLTR